MITFLKLNFISKFPTPSSQLASLHLPTKKSFILIHSFSFLWSTWHSWCCTTHMILIQYQMTLRASEDLKLHFLGMILCISSWMGHLSVLFTHLSTGNEIKSVACTFWGFLVSVSMFSVLDSTQWSTGVVTLDML